MGELSKDLKALVRKIEHFRDELPLHLGQAAVNFSRGNFRKQGFQAARVEPWAPRKGGADPGRAILVKTGALRRSIRVISYNRRRVVIGSDMPYAKAHNEGAHIKGTYQVGAYRRRKARAGKGKPTSGTVEVSAHSRRVNHHLPARPFLGPSPALNQLLHQTAARLWRKRVNL